MKIIVAKLVTGDVIVGEETDTDIIKKCVGLKAIQKSQTQIETHILPLLHPFSDEFLNVGTEQIVFSTTANKSLEDQYKRLVSNIVLAGSSELSKLNQSNITDFVPRRK
jgi:hypothetical protein